MRYTIHRMFSINTNLYNSLNFTDCEFLLYIQIPLIKVVNRIHLTMIVLDHLVFFYRFTFTFRVIFVKYWFKNYYYYTNPTLGYLWYKQRMFSKGLMVFNGFICNVWISKFYLNFKRVQKMIELAFVKAQVKINLCKALFH